jgi:hypothetical protein
MPCCLMRNSYAMPALFQYPQTGEASTLNTSPRMKRPTPSGRIYGE